MTKETERQSRQVTGKVKWFDPAKGFGFVIADEGGPDILLHGNVLRNFGLSSIADGAGVVISVNGNNSASASIDLGGTPPPTIQDLVDRINNTGGLSDQIEASFDDQTGQIQIRAISPDVETIDISLSDEQTTGNFETQLGFGNAHTG